MNFKTTVEREKEAFGELYPPVTIGYDGNETDYFRREKFLETLEQAMTNAALAVFDMIENLPCHSHGGELPDGKSPAAYKVEDIETLKASLTTKE